MINRNTVELAHASHLNPFISETVRACLVKSDLDLKYKFDKEHKEKNHQDELK
jgi:hypothetical protein